MPCTEPVLTAGPDDRYLVGSGSTQHRNTGGGPLPSRDSNDEIIRSAKRRTGAREEGTRREADQQHATGPSLVYPYFLECDVRASHRSLWLEVVDAHERPV